MVFINSPRSFQLQTKFHIYSLTVLVALFLVERMRMNWHAEFELGLACIPTGATSGIEIFAATFIYAMVYDFVVLLLTTYKLFVNYSSQMLARSHLIQMVYLDGLIFFIVACVICILLFSRNHK